jgi:hypothetical protein
MKVIVTGEFWPYKKGAELVITKELYQETPNTFKPIEEKSSVAKAKKMIHKDSKTSKILTKNKIEKNA